MTKDTVTMFITMHYDKKLFIRLYVYFLSLNFLYLQTPLQMYRKGKNLIASFLLSPEYIWFYYQKLNISQDFRISDFIFLLFTFKYAKQFWI